MTRISTPPRRQTIIFALTIALAFGCLVINTIQSCTIPSNEIFVPYCSAEQIIPREILGFSDSQAVLPSQLVISVLIIAIFLSVYTFDRKIDPRILARTKWLHPLLPRGWPPAQKFIPRLCAVRDP